MTIIKIPNTGGINIRNTFHPDRPPSSNARYRLYPGIRAPQPGNHAFSKSLRREIIIRVITATQSIPRKKIIPPNIKPNAVASCAEASGVMLPDAVAPLICKKKFIEKIKK